MPLIYIATLYHTLDGTVCTLIIGIHINDYRLEKMLKGEIFSTAQLSEIGVFMDLTMKEANTQTDVCSNLM